MNSKYNLTYKTIASCLMIGSTSVLLINETKASLHPLPPPPPELACDATWAWNSLATPSSERINGTVSGPIADVNGKLFSTVFFGSGTYGTLQCYDQTRSRWIPYISRFINGSINVMVASGNKLYIAGSFQGFYNGSGGFVAATNVAVLDANTWSPIGTGVSTDIESIAVDSIGNVYLGLSRLAPIVPETGFPGMLVKYDANSQLWLPVGGGLRLDIFSSGPCTTSSEVHPMISPPYGVTALTANGTDIYVAGFFDMCGGNIAARHLAKWNGTSQSWTAIATGEWCYFYYPSAHPYINALAVNSGKLYVAGYISPPCGASYPQGLAEFSTSGAGLVSNAADNLWLGYYVAFDGTTGYDTGTGYDLRVQDCEIYVAGMFQSIGAYGGGSQSWGIAKQLNGSGAWSSVGGSSLSWGFTYQNLPVDIYNPCAPSYLTSDSTHVYASGGGYDTFDAVCGVSTLNIAAWTAQAIIAPTPD